MFQTDVNKDLLLQYAEDLSVHITPPQARQLLKHVDLVEQKNQVMNLTRIRNLDEVLIRHILDSLLCVHKDLSLDISKNSKFLDIGTGGGFPGIPIGIVSEAQGLLIDSIGKKVNAVSEFIDELELSNLKAEKIRAEELALKQKNYFDFVFSRACDHLGVLSEYSSPLLKKHGILVATKGKLSLEELSEAKFSMDLCGMKIQDTFEFDLPKENGHRTIVLIEKVTKAKIKLPRQNGMAKRKKLWDGNI